MSPETLETPDALSIAAVPGIALRRVLSRPRLVLLLWVLSLLLSLCATLPVLAGLAEVLDLRPLGAALAAGRADFLWAEVIGDHPALLSSAVAALLGAAGLHFVLSALLTAGLLAGLRRPGDPRRVVGAQVLSQAARQGPAVLGVALWGLLLRVPPLGLGLLIERCLERWGAGASLPRLVAVTLPGALLVLLLWSAGSVVIHYGQLCRMEHPRGRGGPLPGLRALEQGLLLATRSGRKAALTLLLACCSLAGLGLLLAAERLLLKGLGTGHALATGLLLRQLCAMGRAVIALTILAGAVEAVDTQQR